MFSEKDLQTLEELCESNLLLKKLFTDYTRITSDDAAGEFYLEFIETIRALIRDMKQIRNGNDDESNLFSSNDKKFERIMKLLIEGGTIFDSLKKGRDIVIPQLNGRVLKKSKDNPDKVIV